MILSVDVMIFCVMLLILFTGRIGEKMRESLPLDHRALDNKTEIKSVIVQNQDTPSYRIIRREPCTEASGGDIIMAPDTLVLALLAEGLPHPDIYIDVQEMPQPLNLKEINDLIRYPDTLRPLKLSSNKVFFKVLVDENGMPLKYILKKTPHPLLSDEIKKVILQLRFSPALKDNHPIKSWCSVRFEVQG